jgi:hypothetical protein
MRVSSRWAPSGALLVLAMSTLGACAEPPAQAGGSPASASPQVVEAVRAATTRSAGKTELVPVPGGGQLQKVTLGEGYQHVMVGRLEPDGTVSAACVDSAPQAEAFLSGSRAGVQ